MSEADEMPENLEFDIAFMLSKISKSELSTLQSHDCTKKDAVRRNIAERIAKRLLEGHVITRRHAPGRPHSTSFGSPEPRE